MIYAFIQDGKIVDYPLGEYEIKSRHSNVSFAEPFVPPEGYIEVIDTPRPTEHYTKVIHEGAPKVEDGQCFRTWIVNDAPEEVIAARIAFQWESIRGRRKVQLMASDWTQLPDAPVDAAIWVEYRQALRDITDQEDPFNIVWPSEPGA